MSKPQFDRSPIQFDWVQDHEQFTDYEAEINGLRLRLTWSEELSRWYITATTLSGIEVPCGEPTEREMEKMGEPADDDNTCFQCGGEIGASEVKDVCSACVVENDVPVIKPNPNVMGHRTTELPSSLTVAQINKRLGFKPNVADDPNKVKHSWGFTIDGKECAIWDYKGSRWSAYDPHGVLDRVFPELVRG